MEKIKLANNLTLYCQKMPNVNTVALAVGVRIGSIYEEPEKRGISHLLEHMMFKSNEKYSWKEISQIFELSGGYVNASTYRYWTTYYFEVIRDSFPKAMNVLYWMLKNEKYKEEEFKNEKKVVITEIRKYKEDPNSWIYNLGPLALYGRSDLGDPIGGYVETVNNIEKKDVEEFKEDYYSPQNMVAFLIGAVDEEILNTTVKYLESLDDKGRVKLKNPKGSEGGDIVEERGSEQYYFARTFKHDFPLHKVKIFEYLLTYGMSSILFQELREKRGIGYSIGSWVDKYFFEIVVSGYVKEKHKELLEIMDKVWELEYDESFVEGKKRQVRYSIEKIKQNPLQLAAKSASLYFDGYTGIEEYENALMRERWELSKLEEFRDALIK